MTKFGLTPSNARMHIAARRGLPFEDVVMVEKPNAQPRSEAPAKDADGRS